MWRWVVVLAIANPLVAGDLYLCVENPARLDEYTLSAFRTELGAILSASGRPAGFTACGPGVVRITIRQYPPREEPSALGATRYKDGRLLPEIELFAGPVSQMIGIDLAAVLGRALARVATHELGHWLTQDGGHTRRGVMMAWLSAGHLLAADRSFFLLPPAH